MDFKKLNSYKSLFVNSLSIVCLFAYGTTHAQSADIVVTTSIDKTQIGVNQRFELTVEITGKKANTAEQPELPNMDAFAAYSGSSSSQNIQIINGAMSVTKGYTYYFIAREIGQFTIEPVVVRFKGKVFKSKPIDIEIVKSAASSSGRQRQGQNGGRTPVTDNPSENLFLKASVNRKKVYLNEPVIVDYKLYFRVQVTNYAFTNQPNYGDFWAEEFPGYEQPQVSNETVNGVQYRVATIKKVALFPTSAGQKTIPGQEMEASVRVRERRGRRDFFDSFFDDPFFGRNVARSIASEPVTIDVLPLPNEGRPKHFSGAVGQFNISAKVDRTESKTNEAIKLKVVISGVGNIKIVPQPETHFTNVFEVYDPKVSEKVNRTNNRISGTKTFDYVLIPRRSGTFALSAFRFTYFDPQIKQYRSATTKPITLTIEQGDEVLTSVGSGFSKEEVKLLGEDIRFIETAVGSFSDMNQKFYSLLVFWVVLLAPFALLLTSMYYRSHLEHLRSNVAYARSRKALKVAQKQLKEAKQAMDSGEITKFYSESANALTKFVGNKLNLDEAALVTDELAARLRERKIANTVVEEYQKLLSECDFRRFGNSDAPEKTMADFYEQVRNNLADLERAL